MIYTVTLNPCLDRHLVVDQVKPDDANRIQLERRYAAGKGVDVSRVVAELGGRTTALGFLGGFDGLELEGRLVNQGVECSFTRISGETRTNIHVFDRATGQHTSYNAKGPEIQPIELGLICDRVRSLTNGPDFVALCGSIPRGVAKTIYSQFGRWLKEDGARVVLDADGEAFQHGLDAQPFMIKPNLHELSRLTGEDLREASLSDIVRHAETFLDNGVELALVSMGARGVVAASNALGSRLRLHAQPPEIQVQSSIGSGDSLIAGTLFGLERADSLEDSIRLGVACGAATAMSPGTALCKKETVDQLLPGVRLHSLTRQ